MGVIGECVKKIIDEQLDVKQEEATNNASFVEDLGADSLDIAESAMVLEEEFDIGIPGEETEKTTIVQAVIDYINGHQAWVNISRRSLDRLSSILLSHQNHFFPLWRTDVSKHRAAAIGPGMLSLVGNTVESTWRVLLAGQSGISLIDRFNTSAYTTKFAGLIRNFNCEDIISCKGQCKMDTLIQYGIVVDVQAMQDSGLKVTKESVTRIGAVIGLGVSGFGLIEENHMPLMNDGPCKISPFFTSPTIVNMVTGHLIIVYGLHGLSISIATACTSGVHNTDHIARIIAYGDADVIVTGDAEKASTPLGVDDFSTAHALSTRNDNPQAASRLWDKERDGFVLGDGAGVLVFEEYEHARKRGVKIYTKLVGSGMNSDAYHMASPPENGVGAVLAMANTLRNVGIEASQIGYVNAHGISTSVDDKAEAQAMKTTFGEATDHVLVSSTKSVVGHLSGAAGAVESIYSILVLHDQVTPPTANPDNPGGGCDLDFVPYGAHQVGGMEYTLCNSFGFNGTNDFLIFRKI